jgi:hypothetical protein
MTATLHLAALCAALAGALFLAGSVVALRRRRVLAGTIGALVTALLLSLSSLLGVLGVGVRGYRALTHEELAAHVTTRPVGPQHFRADFRFPDGREVSYSLAGDEFYVDAHILKWKPIANLLGAHTAYELDRVSGRYVDLDDERGRPRTVHSLSEPRALDLFAWRRRTPVLGSLVDAEYGSATFVPANAPAEYDLRVSTSGLMVRRAGSR